MGRSTKKQLSEIESLQQEIRDLKDINRELHQKLKKQARKTKEPKEEKEEKNEEIIEPNPSKSLCPKCKVGTIVTTDIGVKFLDMCDNVTCKARKTRKK